MQTAFVVRADEFGGPVKPRHPEPGLDLFGEPGTEQGARRALERTLRDLARTESDHAVRIGLVDQANTVRPRTLW